MQAYSQAFARAYNMRWTHFASAVAPRILDFYERSAGESALASSTGKSVLDVCCGTGQLALYFLEKGYRVTGIDASAGMLSYARENTAAYAQEGRARFEQADAAHFSLGERYGLVVATFDALNHLENLATLRQCFESVYPVLADDGFFIFDLNTRAGLLRWNNIGIEDDEEVLIISRGLYIEQDLRAWVRITGFIRNADGLYERFEETAFNTVFEMDAVRAALCQAGWRTIHFARSQDLATPVADPEQEARVFCIARK